MARYVIDLDRLEETGKVARVNAEKLGVHLLMALKSFPLPAALPTLAKYVEGFTCSGLYEAKLVNSSICRFVDSSGENSSICRFVDSSNRVDDNCSNNFNQTIQSKNRRIDESINSPIHVHAPAYTDEEMPEVISTCSHIVFNSLAQLEKFGPAAKAAGRSVGLRINPGFSSADCLAYDPYCPDSRFGVLFDELEDYLQTHSSIRRFADSSNAVAENCSNNFNQTIQSKNRKIEESINLIDGLHLHALCEGYADQFADLVERLADRFGALLAARDGTRALSGLKWINLGGGEVINDPAFASPRAIAAVQKLKAVLSSPTLYIEPSEYLVRYAGSLEATVLDVIHREKDIAILDVSASCHATDLLLFNMKPDIISPPLLESTNQSSSSSSSSRVDDHIFSESTNFPKSKVTILAAVSCLAGDVFGEYEFARPLKAGDKVIFGGLGSYSFAQLSWFNGIRHPDIVIRSGGAERVVRHWDYRDFAAEFAAPALT